MAQTETQNHVEIIKYGRGMNAKKSERRYLYLRIDPPPPPDQDVMWLKDIASKLKALEASWDPPILAEHLATGPWWLYTANCIYCRRRHHYERQAWVEGRWVWPRRLCMRHYLVWHLYVEAHEGVVNTNRLIHINASRDNIAMKMDTANYSYDIHINRQEADMTVKYKDSVYRYTYKNHENAYPHMSSYDLIIFSVTSLFNRLAETLRMIPEWRPYNVVINDIIKLRPTVDS
jgi:hypothetical protein